MHDGKPLHLEWHQRRVKTTLSHFFPATIPEGIPDLNEILIQCEIPPEGLYRCRVIYDLHTLSIEFYTYTPRVINSLRFIEVPEGYDYSFKFADRKVLEDLYTQRGDADDILLTRNGWITDTSIANVAFRKSDRWYTPSRPLLAGTSWKRLVAGGVLIPRPIHQDDIWRYDAFKIFNAMNDFEDLNQWPVKNIFF